MEDGSTVSDNIVSKPRELTLTNGVVSDTPIGVIAKDPTRQAGSSRPSLDCYAVLKNIYTARKTVTVVSNFEKYDSMALEDLSVPRDSKTFGGLVFTAKFKQIVVVKNQRVTVAVPNLSPKTTLGPKPAKPWASTITTDAIWVVTKIYPQGIPADAFFAAIPKAGRTLVLQEVHGTDDWFHLKIISGEIPDGYVLHGEYNGLNAIQIGNAASNPINYNAQADQWANNRQKFLSQSSPSPGNPSQAVQNWPAIQGKQ